MFTQEQNQFLTIRDLLRFAISQFNKSKLFFGHGSTTAFDEAAYLVLSTLHLPLDQLDPFLDARLMPEEKTAVLRMIERRITEKKPAAYLTNEAWLGNFRFYVDERVIVPRSFIAELLQTQLAPWISDPDKIYNALDLCTGSACLAILMAHAFNNTKIDAIDISADALEVAHRNIADYELQQRIRVIQSDLFSNLSKQRYDLIISNPPYVNAKSMLTLPEEYCHEPQIALASGDDGLVATRRIIHQAANYLNEDGMLIVEIGHNRKSLEKSFPQTPFTWLETSAGDEFVFMLKHSQLPNKS
jgi:ribosomal protein L3 glutamine methyltransferase